MERVRSFRGDRRAVFDLLAAAVPEKQVAARLGMKPDTVHWHIKVIYADLDVHSHAELVAMVGWRQPARVWVMVR